MSGKRTMLHTNCAMVGALSFVLADAAAAATPFEPLAEHGSARITLLDTSWGGSVATGRGAYYLVSEADSSYAWYSDGTRSRTIRIVEDSVRDAVPLADGGLAFVRSASAGAVVLEEWLPAAGVRELWRSSEDGVLHGLHRVGSALVLEVHPGTPTGCATELYVLEAPDYSYVARQRSSPGCRAFGDWLATADAMYRVDQPNRTSNGTYWLTRFFPADATLQVVPGPAPDGRWDYPHRMQTAAHVFCGKDLSDYGTFSTLDMYCVRDDASVPIHVFPEGGVGVRLRDFGDFVSIGERVVTYGMRILDDGTEESPGMTWSIDGVPAAEQPLLGFDSWRCLADRSDPQLLQGRSALVEYDHQLWLSDGTLAGTSMQLEYGVWEAPCTGAGAWRRGAFEALLVAAGSLAHFDRANRTLTSVPDVPPALVASQDIEHVVPQGTGFLIFRRAAAAHPAMVWVHFPGRIFQDGLEP